MLYKKAKGKLHSSPHLRRPHTDLGSIIYHTAREYNTRLKKKLIDQGLPEPQVQSQLAKRAIKVRPMLISASHTKQYGRKVASEIRERAIEELGKKQVITFTRSGDIERKYERGARQLFENLQEARKDSGFKSKGASDKLIDQFIDEVNVEIDGKPKYSHEFKQGAYEFLENKEMIGKDFYVNMGDQKLETDIYRIKGRTIIDDVNQTLISRGVFTTCKKTDGCPPWRIEAEEINHDKKKKINEL